MSWDLVNGMFEMFGAVAMLPSIYRLWKDKNVKGVSWFQSCFFMAWGVWNLGYYPSLDQWWSFYGGVALVIVNTVWMAQRCYYAWRAWRRTRSWAMQHEREGRRLSLPEGASLLSEGESGLLARLGKKEETVMRERDGEGVAARSKFDDDCRAAGDAFFDLLIREIEESIRAEARAENPDIADRSLRPRDSDDVAHATKVKVLARIETRLVCYLREHVSGRIDKAKGRLVRKLQERNRIVANGD